MKFFAKTKLKESFFVFLGFVAWLAFDNACESRMRDSAEASYLGGALIFFVSAFFIEERPQGSFISRNQVIGVATFFLWIGLNNLFYFGEYRLHQKADSTVSDMAFGISSIGVPFVFYWGAKFLIRGFYTPLDLTEKRNPP